MRLTRGDITIMIGFNSLQIHLGLVIVRPELKEPSETQETFRTPLTSLEGRQYQKQTF